MELKHLLHFLAIAEQGSLTRAARQFGISPQAMSVNLTKLEQSLGAPLFERSGGGSALTREGKALLSYARSITAEAERATEAVQMAHLERSGTLHIGVGEAITNLYVPQAVARVREKFPDIKIILEEAYSEELLARMAEGEFDVFIGAMPDEWQGTDDLVMRYLFETHDQVVARSDHPLAHRVALKVTDLVGYPWLISAKRADQYATVCSAFVVADLPVPTEIVWADSASVGLSLVLAENYLTLSTAGVFPELYSAGLLARLDVDQPIRARKALLANREGATLAVPARIFMETIIAATGASSPDRHLA